ncbi:MAG: hypothetical protein J0L76_12905 [Rhodobacterales bacterium]|nr:hypothetical protein [Rhodobacterales bacterium]
MRLLPTALTLIALATSALADSTEPLPQITLTGGEGVVVPGTRFTLLLTEVTDQRCPANVDCYWEGMQRAKITVMTPKPELLQVVLCNLCDDGTSSAEVPGLKLFLGGLVPSTEELAKLGREPLLTDYKLIVTYLPVSN